MSDADLMGFFFSGVPSEGYQIEGSHCVVGENTREKCSNYEGVIDPKNIWTFDLTSGDGKITQKVETSIVNLSEPRICFKFQDQEGKSVALEVSPKNCKITKEGFLCISQSDQGQKFTIKIRKV